MVATDVEKSPAAATEPRRGGHMNGNDSEGIIKFHAEGVKFRLVNIKWSADLEEGKIDRRTDFNHN